MKLKGCLPRESLAATLNEPVDLDNATDMPHERVLYPAMLVEVPLPCITHSANLASERFESTTVSTVEVGLQVV